jgi:molecular chaperone GrpE
MADEDTNRNRTTSPLNGPHRDGPDRPVSVSGEAAPRAGDPEPSTEAGFAEEGGAVGDAERLRSQLELLQSEVTSARDRALRERADLENYKKRVARDKDEAVRFANEKVFRDLLPIIDNLHRAIEHARMAGEDSALVEGLNLVLRQFADTLERHGVAPVNALDTTFDPSRHEAIGHIESEHPSNTVLGEHQRGYTLNDRLLRPALVTVSKGPGRGGES